MIVFGVFLGVFSWFWRSSHSFGVSLRSKVGRISAEVFYRVPSPGKRQDTVLEILAQLGGGVMVKFLNDDEMGLEWEASSEMFQEFLLEIGARNFLLAGVYWKQLDEMLIEMQLRF